MLQSRIQRENGEVRRLYKIGWHNLQLDQNEHWQDNTKASSVAKMFSS